MFCLSNWAFSLFSSHVEIQLFLLILLKHTISYLTYILSFYHQTSSLTKSLPAVWIFDSSTFGLVSKYLPIDEGKYKREGESVKNIQPDAKAFLIKSSHILYAFDSNLTWRGLVQFEYLYLDTGGKCLMNCQWCTAVVHLSTVCTWSGIQVFFKTGQNHEHVSDQK